MNNKGQIGQILTRFPSLILVFVIMLVFVIIAGFISKSHFEGYSLLEDFLDDSISFEGKIITVNDAIERMCVDESLEGGLKVVLRKHFIEEYGSGNAFVIVNSINGYGKYVLSVWVGVFDEIDNNIVRPAISPDDFEKVFDKSSQRKKIVQSSQNQKICNFVVYVKSGGAKHDES